MRREVVPGVVDHLHVGELVRAAVAGELLSRIEQHLVNAGSRANPGNAITSLQNASGRTGMGKQRTTLAPMPTEPDPSAGKTDLPGKRRERRYRPIRHLAVMRTLDGPGPRDLSPRRGTACRQRSYLTVALWRLLIDCPQLFRSQPSSSFLVDHQ